MTTIDHRILIPAAPDIVWDYVSDITHNPDWQVDCTEVIFLTSRREGPGLRWRYATPGGRELVIAVTAWYNGLGYEYYFVDGTSFRENKGRIRLQEIPEGTIVQWTFTYELGGVLGGIRNSLGMSRQVDQTIAESLKTLWQKIKASGAASRPHEAKSLMRDAPNVDARSNYQPRHPSAAQPEKAAAPPVPTPVPEPLFKRPVPVEPPLSEGDAEKIILFAEPPIVEEDTKPRAPVTSTAELIPADIEGEPEFLESIEQVDLSRFEPPRKASDTQPRAPISTSANAPTPETTAPPAVVEVTPPILEPAVLAAAAIIEPVLETKVEAPLKGEETEPLGFPLPEVLPTYPADQPLANSIPAVVPEPEPETEQPTAPVPEPETTQPATPIAEIGEETQPDVAVKAPETAPVIVEPPPLPIVKPQPLAEPEPELPVKAGEAVSIWDVFGVPRPSDTPPQPIPAVAAISETASALAPEAVLESEAPAKMQLPRPSSRVGLRVAMRRSLVHVRRP